MKILHLDTGKGWRGGQQQLFWLMEGLRDLGHEQLLLAPSSSPLAERTRKAGLEVAELSPQAMSFANLRGLPQKAVRFDLLHAHDARGHSLAWLAGIGRSKKSWPRLVVSRRVAYPIGFFSRLKYGAADAYIAVSDYVRQQLLQASVPEEKIHVVLDGVKLPRLPAGSGNSSELRRRFGVGEKTFLIGTLATIAPEKLLQDSVDLLVNLPSTMQLWLGTPGLGLPESDADQQAAEKVLLEHARKRGVEKRFQIVRLGEDLSAFLGSLDMFLYLSKSEGLGSAILLAMAYNLPVVASNVGGIPEIVRHMEEGLLAGKDWKSELPPAIRLLRDSARTRQRLADAGRRFVMTHATTDIMASRTAAVYAELLQGSNRNRA